jgi:2-oxoglutarate ferredoxin oxidoreductase subunit delta
MSKVKSKNQVTIDTEMCKGCELCINECPQGILSISEKLNSKGYYPVVVKDSSACTGCTFCAIACPEAIIEILRRED